MPLYDFECNRCGSVQEEVQPMDVKETACESCGGETRRLISAPRINPDLEFVTSDITGHPVRVTSRKHMKRLCEENGVMPKVGKGWK